MNEKPTSKGGHRMNYFPLLIKITDSHGLEPSARPGFDYDQYLIVNDINELPNNISFKVCQTNFTGHSVNKKAD